MYVDVFMYITQRNGKNSKRQIGQVSYKEEDTKMDKYLTFSINCVPKTKYLYLNFKLFVHWVMIPGKGF